MNRISAKQVLPFFILAAIAVIACFIKPVIDFVDTGKYNAADTAWIIVATALVFLMTPGLAFFYGGMVHRKNVLSTMIKSMVAAGIVSVLWIVVGYSLCFGDDIGHFIGNPMTHLFYKGVNSGEPWSLAPTIPKTLFSLFQLMFAIITPALVVGAVAERIERPLRRIGRSRQRRTRRATLAGRRRQLPVCFSGARVPALVHAVGDALRRARGA